MMNMENNLYYTPTMEELIQEFREWNRSWDLYHLSLKEKQTLPKPISVDVFIEQLNLKYKITKL